MKFNQLEKYNKELTEMEKTLREMEEFIEKNPEEFGTIENYKTYKYVYNIFKKDKILFLKELNQINLRLQGININKNFTIGNVNKICDKLNNTENSTTHLLEKSIPSNTNLNIETIAEEPVNITFTFENPTDEDILRTSSRKKGLLKIFDFINCKDNIEKLKKEAGPEGKQVLKSYKEFLEEIVKHNADFTLDTEYGTLKTGMNLQQAKNICENLKI